MMETDKETNTLQTSTVVKWLLIMVAVLILGCSGIFVGGGYLFYRNRDTIKDSLKERTVELRAEATAFAETHPKDTCFDKAMDRMKGCFGFTCEIEGRIFLKMCLKEAQPSPGLCDDVPSILQLGQVAMWQLSECRARPTQIEQQRCGRALQELIDYCDEEEE